MSKNSSDTKETFFRCKKLGKGPNDYWDSYQIEVCVLQGNKIIKREMVDKPDTKQMTLAKAELMLNPDEVPLEVC